IVQDGATFTWNATQFDARARPTSVTRGSSLSSSVAPNSIVETTEYHDRLDTWVLGQIKKITSDGSVAVENIYYANSPDLYQTKAFGVLKQSFTWNPDGTLASLADGAGHATTFSNYKRGYPQQVLYADGALLNASVNNDGDVEWL